MELKLESDQANSIIIEDEKRRQEEEKTRKSAEEARLAEERAQIEAEQNEEKRQRLISELTEKIAQNPQNSANLEQTIAKTYDEFVHDEEKAKTLAKRFGVPHAGAISNANAKQLIEQITANLQDISVKVESASINGETTLEDAKQSYTTLTPLLDGVTYGTEIAKSFPELVALNKQQLDAETRKKVYDRVQTAMQAARIQKYDKEKVAVRDEKISFLGRLFGKEQLKETKLKNLDLKKQLAELEVQQPQNGYSMKELLADMQVCSNTELGGEFTPEMQELYKAIKATYHDKRSDEFSETYIKQMANERQANNEKSGLLAVQDNRPRLFGKSRAQAQMIELENQSLRQKILKIRTTNATRNVHSTQEANAVALFEQKLRGIAVNTQERDIQRLIKSIETTVELWK